MNMAMYELNFMNGTLKMTEAPVMTTNVKKFTKEHRIVAIMDRL